MLVVTGIVVFVGMKDGVIMPSFLIIEKFNTFVKIVQKRIQNLQMRLDLSKNRQINLERKNETKITLA